MAAIPSDNAVEVVHRCPQMYTGRPHREGAPRRGQGFLSGLCHCWPFNWVSVPSGSAVFRYKTGRLPLPGRVSEFCFRCDVSDRALLIAPVVSDDDEISPFRVDGLIPDRAICRGWSVSESLHAGFSVGRVGDVTRVSLGYVLPVRHLFLGLHLWNTSGKTVMFDGWFVVEEALPE